MHCLGDCLTESDHATWAYPWHQSCLIDAADTGFLRTVAWVAAEHSPQKASSTNHRIDQTRDFADAVLETWCDNTLLVAALAALQKYWRDFQLDLEETEGA